MKKNKTQKIIFIGLLIVCVIGMFPTVTIAQTAETATVRIISTTDLHGQLANTNYDTAGEKSVGSLAQDYTLIKEARKEIQYGTSVTVDVGDTIYGFGSDYNHGNDGKEYMYTAMEKMGYDAITLGNHDFDYGYKYAKNQLKNEGLEDICVLSNVYDAVTGKNVWNENKLLTKTVTTSKKKKVTVKIGIIGVTRPGLTNYYNHIGILTTKDMIKSTEEQVRKLKNKGADLIVVMAHSGIGKENPEKNSGDAAYAISKIDGVDAVMCGHSHLNYPSSDTKVQRYYELPNVNKRTGLMNGKPVVMVEDHGAGIGIADLKIKISNGKVSLVSSKASIKYATKNTVSDPAVLKYQAIYDKRIKKIYNEKVGELDKNTNITNYFGLLEDNTAIQLVNEAKIQLGLEYINTKNTDYKNCPVIAVSTYKKYGVESKDDYVNIDGTITMADVLSIQSYYHDYSYVYWITGKQIREWLEWIASAYEVPGSSQKSGDEIIDQYVDDMGMSSLIKKDWIDNWGKFFIFDGIEYDIDITQPAKYSIDGTIMNEGASRVKKLNYNGREILDDSKLILVSDIITPSKTVVGAAVGKQRLYKSGEYSANLLKSYIKELSQFGTINVKADDNWRVLIPSTENYIIRSSALSEDTAKIHDWYQETLDISENFAYYKGKFSSSYEDKSGPTLVVSPTIRIKTNKDIPIIVQANDSSQVTYLRYAFGLYNENDGVWATGGSNTVLDGQFIANQNGTYSVWAMDTYGNRTVKYIEVSNINREVLQVPTVNRVTNKSTSVTGKGEPGATITIKASGSAYTTVVNENGLFLCKIGFQNADDIIKVNQKDQNGKSSDYKAIKVLRAGPNYPILTEINNKNTVIRANINDVNSQIFALIGDKVYVAQNGGKNAYMSSTRFDANYDIVETRYTKTGNSVALSIPVQYAGTDIKIYAVDHIGRINYPINTKVKEVAPEMPVLYNVCDGERFVYGYVPKSEGLEYSINVAVGEDIYSGISDTNGYFKIEVDKVLEGQKVYATASDIVNNKIRESAKGSKEVHSYLYYSLGSGANAFIEPMTNKDTVVRGNVTDFTGIAYLKIGDIYYDLDVIDSKSFEFPLEKPLEAGQIISIVLREEFSNIKEAEGCVVKMTLPDKPTLLNKYIYTTTKTIKIESAEKCYAHVKIGSKVYTAKDRTFDEATGLYTYIVKIEKSKADKTVYIYMENEVGKSSRIKLTVKEKEKEEQKEEKEEEIDQE